MGDVIIALAPLYFMACFYYGYRILLVGATAVLSCLLADWLCSYLLHGRINSRDLSSVVTGLIIPMLMTPAIDLPIVVAASLFAILVCKAPFGGTGHNIFNPAAAGVAFATICWSDQIFSYTQPLTHLPAAIDSTVTFLQGPTATLKLGGIPRLDLTELLLGNFPGPIGSTYTLIIAASLAKNTRLYKAIAKIDKKAVIDCSGTKRWELPRRVQQMATQHGKSISTAAAEELVSRSGENTRMLDNDLAKLAQMVEAPQIELADVERWIVRTAEVQPWDFLNAVSARDMRRSLELFNLLPAKSYVWTYTLLCGRIRELIVAKALDARGQGRELAATLKLQSWQVKNHLTWARRFSMAELVAALEGAVNVELALKGSADSQTALLLWITNILRKS